MLLLQPKPIPLGGGLAAIAAIVLAGSLIAPGEIMAQDEPPVAVPRAACGPEDKVETMQGRITLAERFAPQPTAFNCNLQLIGHLREEGSGWGMNAVGDCAYMSTWYNAQRQPALAEPGTVVIDVSDPANPRATTRLTSPAMLNVNESLSYSEAADLLLGGVNQANNEPTLPIDIYDISDCAQPKLLSSTVIPQMRTHGGAFTPDGRVYYGVSCCGPNQGYDGPISAIFAIDVSDPANPKEIARWIPENDKWQTHWLSLNEDGTRAYITLIELQNNSEFENGLVVLDVSEVTGGAADPEIKLVSSVMWETTGFGEHNVYFQKDGRDYVVQTDMSGSLSFFAGFQDPSVCGEGRPAWGQPIFVDVTDDAQPEVVGRLTIEVGLPENCAETAEDPTQMGGYSPAFCDVNAPVDPTLLACGYMEGGVRVFDIRNIEAPREVGYFKPAPTRSDPSPGSFQLVGVRFPMNTADSVVVPKFRDGGREIWINGMDNGFMTVRFSDAFIEANSELFVPAQ